MESQIKNSSGTGFVFSCFPRPGFPFFFQKEKIFVFCRRADWSLSYWLAQPLPCLILSNISNPQTFSLVNSKEKENLSKEKKIISFVWCLLDMIVLSVCLSINEQTISTSFWSQFFPLLGRERKDGLSVLCLARKTFPPTHCRSRLVCVKSTHTRARARDSIHFFFFVKKKKRKKKIVNKNKELYMRVLLWLLF